MGDNNKNLEKQLSSPIYEFLKVLSYRSYKLYGKEYICDICVVKNKEKDRVFIRLQKRWFGVSKNMKKSGETKPRWIVFNSYNFTQKFEFEKAIKIFNQISQKGLNKVDHMQVGTGISLAVDEIIKLKNTIQDLEKRKRKDKKTKDQIRQLRQKVNFLDEENTKIKKGMLRTQLPEYKEIVKSTFNDLNTKGEGHFQKLFTNNKWIFGPAYEDIIPKRKADTQNQPDFVLKRYDGFSDIVEIESPSKQLFTKPNKSKKSQPTSLLTQAITQAMDYIESYNQKYKDLFYDDSRDRIAIPIHAYYPRGFVIIGKDKDTDRKKLRQLNNFLHNITVLTYDEFLKQAERMIKMMEK